MAQGYVLPDSSFYFAQQTAFGTPGTTLKGAMGVTSYEITPNKDTIEGVPMLGRGYWRAQDIPAGVTVGWRVTGYGALSQLATFMAVCASGIIGTTTVLAVGGFTTPFTMNARNSTKKYMTLAIVENETSTPGTGLLKAFLRDAVAGSVQITIQSKSLFTFEASGNAINEGPGAATGITFSFNTALHVPNISNPATALTYPSIFPAGFCSTQLNLSYSADLAYGPNCIGSVEASDILVDNARWMVSGSGIADTNFANFYRSVNYGTTTPTANVAALTATLATGSLTIQLVSDDIISGTSPATPFGITFTFPDMQYTSARFTGSAPRIGEWAAKSFNANMTISVNNDLAAASMAI